MTHQIKRYDETFRRYVVKEIEDGGLSQADAARQYGISKGLVRIWLEEYGRYRPKRDVVEVVMKSEQEKIQELEKALSEAHLKIRAYEELLKIAEKNQGGSLKKNTGTTSSAPSAGKGGQLKKPVKP
jgi:transposase-like protein